MDEVGRRGQLGVRLPAHLQHRHLRLPPGEPGAGLVEDAADGAGLLLGDGGGSQGAQESWL